MRLDEARRDLYRRMAKEEGYKSRAAYKLIEAAEKYGFLGEGVVVIDFGAAPGGWLQVCAKAVGASGKVVGVDLHEVHLKDRNVSHLTMNVHDPRVVERVLALTGKKADVVLSDLAPSVSGVWELDQTRQVDLTFRVLELCTPLLKEGGTGFVKLFEGERSPEVRDAMRARFKVMRAVKPAASRSASSELYYYLEGWKGEPAASATASATSE